jgi:RHS repeat-associated protein
VTNTYTYDPYGLTTKVTFAGAVANPWRYTGQYQDTTTGLYKIGARYYQAELGRWTQPDPSGLDQNAHLYVAGNPVNFTDPSGLYCLRFPIDLGACGEDDPTVGGQQADEGPTPEKVIQDCPNASVFSLSPAGCIGTDILNALEAPEARYAFPY